MTAAESDPKVTALMDEVVDDHLNREVLYDPIKAMNDAFPAWLERNKQALLSDEFKKYEKQYD